MKTLLSFSLLALLLGQLRVMAEEPQELKPVHRWEGSVDAGGPQPAPSKIIVTADNFSAIWTSCARTDAEPAIDWTRQFALFAATSGSRIQMRAILDAEGGVKALPIATRDLRPGFRYVLLVLPREGVKTVNGAPLP